MPAYPKICVGDRFGFSVVAVRIAAAWSKLLRRIFLFIYNLSVVNINILDLKNIVIVNRLYF